MLTVVEWAWIGNIRILTFIPHSASTLKMIASCNHDDYKNFSAYFEYKSKKFLYFCTKFHLDCKIITPTEHTQ